MGAIPPSAILSRKGIARYGGVSCTGAAKVALDSQVAMPHHRPSTSDDNISETIEMLGGLLQCCDRVGQLQNRKAPTLIFFSLPFLENSKENHQKGKDLISSARRTPKILEKEGKNAQNRKEFLEKEKGKENQKGKEKKIRGIPPKK